ncbi:hypothetical protein HG531_001356 [Fusarium graminearum]|nr:hypothetical protein HG531_001356 [Fusarium graminearum]
MDCKKVLNLKHVTETSAGGKASDRRGRLSRSALTAEGAEEARIGTRQRTGVVVLVDLADVADAVGAGSVGRSIGASEEGTSGSLLDGSLDVLEQVTLGEDLGLVAGLKGVS